MSAPGEPRRYATVGMVRAEAAIVRIVTAAAADRSFVIAPKEAAEQYEKWRLGFAAKIGKPTADLNAEQKAAFKYLLAGGRVSTISGVAGAGKTTMIDSYRSVMESRGYTVLGTAISAKAASGLRDAGVKNTDSVFNTVRDATLALAAKEARESWTGNLRKTFEYQAAPDKPAVETTVHAILEAKLKQSLAIDPNGQFAGLTRKRLAILNRGCEEYTRGETRMFNKWLHAELDKMVNKSELVKAGHGKAVLIVDEFGMVGTDDGAKLHIIAEKLGARFIGMGDLEQISSVAPGSAMRIQSAIDAPAKLIAVTRQTDDTEKRASQLFAEGTEAAARQALTIYKDKGRLHIVGGGFDAEICRQAGEQLGRDLSIGERQAAGLIGQYLAAKGDEREIWSSELGKMAEADRERSPLWQSYVEAQASWKEAARSLAVTGDAPVLMARYGIDPARFAKDYLIAQGMKPFKAGQMAAETADALGLKNAVPWGHAEWLTADFRHSARAAMVADWAAKEASAAAAGEVRSSLMLAFRREDVDRLNAAAHDEMVKAGRLGPMYAVKTADHGTITVGTASRIQVFKNEKGTELRNGTFGTVTGIARDVESNAVVLHLRLDNGQDIAIDTGQFDAFGHGWASTIHKSQGVTVNDCSLLADNLCSRSLAYVGMSRHREDVQVFAAKSDFASEEKLIEKLSQGRQPGLVGDHADIEEITSRRTLGTESARERARALETLTDEDFSHERLKQYGQAGAGQTIQGQAAGPGSPRGRTGTGGTGTGADFGADPFAARGIGTPAADVPLRSLSEVGFLHNVESLADQGILRRVPTDRVEQRQAGHGADHRLRRAEPVETPQPAPAFEPARQAAEQRQAEPERPAELSALRSLYMNGAEGAAQEDAIRMAALRAAELAAKAAADQAHADAKEAADRQAQEALGQLTQQAEEKATEKRDAEKDQAAGQVVEPEKGDAKSAAEMRAEARSATAGFGGIPMEMGGREGDSSAESHVEKGDTKTAEAAESRVVQAAEPSLSEADRQALERYESAVVRVEDGEGYTKAMAERHPDKRAQVELEQEQRTMAAERAAMELSPAALGHLSAAAGPLHAVEARVLASDGREREALASQRLSPDEREADRQYRGAGYDREAAKAEADWLGKSHPDTIAAHEAAIDHHHKMAAEIAGMPAVLARMDPAEREQLAATLDEATARATEREAAAAKAAALDAKIADGIASVRATEAREALAPAYAPGATNEAIFAFQRASDAVMESPAAQAKLSDSERKTVELNAPVYQFNKAVAAAGESCGNAEEEARRMQELAAAAERVLADKQAADRLTGEQRETAMAAIAHEQERQRESEQRRKEDETKQKLMEAVDRFNTAPAADHQAAFHALKGIAAATPASIRDSLPPDYREPANGAADAHAQEKDQREQKATEARAAAEAKAAEGRRHEQAKQRQRGYDRGR